MEKPFDPEDVVISGIGGYFPNSSNIGEFRQRLLANENMLSSRWKAGLYFDMKKIEIFELTFCTGK